MGRANNLSEEERKAIFALYVRGFPERDIYTQAKRSNDAVHENTQLVLTYSIKLLFERTKNMARLRCRQQNNCS